MSRNPDQNISAPIIIAAGSNTEPSLSLNSAMHVPKPRNRLQRTKSQKSKVLRLNFENINYEVAILAGKFITISQIFCFFS